MKTEYQQPGDNKMQLDQCIEKVRFARAAELARSGEYSEAVAMLSPKGQVPEAACELDLLARIHAHQERFDIGKLLSKKIQAIPPTKTVLNNLPTFSPARVCQTVNTAPSSGSALEYA
jgi:hypothetical protein